VIAAAREAVLKAERKGLVDNSFGDVLTGFSGKKFIGALQGLVRACATEETCYLEVGVFQGLTLLATASANPGIQCFGIDNFAFFDPRSENLGLVEKRREALKANNAHIINMGFEDAFLDLFSHTGGKKVSVYLVDGPHDYRSQLMCILLAKKYLADGAVIVIDDSNYPHVRQANADFLRSNPEFKLLFEGYTHCHPKNMTDSQQTEARDGWWNGINILVHDPGNELESAYPPAPEDSVMFNQDHTIHSERLAPLAPEIIALAGALGRPGRLVSQTRRLIAASREKRPAQGIYDHMNTFSDGLTKSNHPLMISR